MKQTAILIFVLWSTFLIADSTTLDSIKFSKERDRYIVTFKGSGNLLYTSSALNNPPRIVLDFPGTKSKLSGSTTRPDNNDVINSVNVSTRSERTREVLSVVIELKAPVDFAFSQVKNGFAVRLNASANSRFGGQYPAASKLPDLSAQLFTQPQGVSDPVLVIGPEDLLDINVFELPQFNTTGRVAGDGTITMPLVGSVKVGGLTKQDAEKKVASALETKYVNNANVSITIKEYKSKQVAILGAVKNPGPYYLTSPRSLLQVISDVGGLTSDAGQKCFVFRNGISRIEIDLADLVIAGNPKWNILIYPGDVINIPTSEKIAVYVLGEVKTPGQIDMPFGTQLTLLTALAKAGGLGPNAKKTIELRRKDDSGKVSIVKLKLSDIMNGKVPDPVLQAGDVINVPTSFF